MSAFSSQAAQARVVTQQAGAAGCHIETGTTAVTGNFVAIEVIEAATFTTLTIANQSGDSPTGFAWPVGGPIIKGNITAFTLSSGKVIAYYGTL